MKDYIFELFIYGIFSLFPFISLGFFITLFFLPKRKKIISALGFFSFSLATYKISVEPFISNYTDHKVFLDHSSSFQNREILAKVAVINSFFSIGLESDKFLQDFWKDLSHQGFDTLVVYQVEGFLASQPKSSLRIFGKKNISISQLGFSIALVTSQKEVMDNKFLEDTKVVWLDWERTFHSQPDFLKLNSYKIIYFPFSLKTIRWYDWFSKLNVHYIYFY